MSYFTLFRSWFTWKQGLAYLTLALLTLASVWWGESLFFWVIAGRIEFLNAKMVWFTSYGFAALLAVLAAYICTWSPEQRKLCTPLILAFLSAFFLSHFFKFLIQGTRPYEMFEIIPLVRERTLSFPSSHTTVAFALIPLLYYVRHWLGWVWFGVSVLVAFSRIYLGVHMPIEVFSGALLGLAIGDFWRIWVTKFRFLYWWEELFELRRQTFHAVFGLLITFAVRWEVIEPIRLLLVAFGGLFLSYLSLYCRLPVLSYFLERFERPRMLATFPGRGAFFYVLSAWLVLTLFPQPVALASILILALMDSTAHVIGKYWGHIPNPLNPKKHLEGFVAGLLAGLFGALFFVPLHVALVGALVGSLIEIFDVRLARFKIDDNLLVPLCTAFAMSFLLY